ncbi:MAG: hypothetical protein WCQ47_08300, partial [bacterium]
MNKLKILFILSVIFFAGNSVYATSGACSSHRGAMCSVGPDSDGSVVCNDGWRDSTVSFYDTDECNSVDSCPFYIRGEDTYNKFKKQWDDTISEIKNRNQNDCEDSFQRYQTITNQSYDSCVSSRRNMVQWGGTFAFNGNNDCEKERDKEIQSNETRKASCLHNSDDAIFKYQRLSSCMRLDTSDYCPSLYGNNSHYNSDKGCICNDGFFFNNNKCTPEKEAQEAVCQDAHGQNAHWDNPIKACTCNTGYVIDKNKNELCVPIDNWC